MSGCERSAGVRITPSHVTASAVTATTPITIHPQGRGTVPDGAVRCHHTIAQPATVARPLRYAAAQHQRNRRSPTASDDAEAARPKSTIAAYEIQLVAA